MATAFRNTPQTSAARHAKKAPSSFLRHRGAIAGVLAATILVVGYLLLIHPIVLNLLPGGEYDVGIKQQELTARQDRLAELEGLKTSYDNIPKSDLDRLEQFLPPESDVPNIMVALEELAEGSGMQLLAVDSNPRKDPVMPNVGAVDVALSVAGGDYPRLRAFLRGLESNLRMFDVTALTFQTSSGTFALNIRAYYVVDR